MDTFETLMNEVKYSEGRIFMDITELTVHELQEKLKNKELTVTEITKASTIKGQSRIAT